MDESERDKLPKRIAIIGTHYPLGPFASRFAEAESAFWDALLDSSRAEPRIIITKGSFLQDERAYRYVPPRGGAFTTIAKTVWVLWGGDVDTIWLVLLQWSTGSDVLKAACDEIISTGFRQGGFSPEDALDRVVGWLSDQHTEQQQAAVNLMPSILPAISKESLSEATSKWTPDKLEKSTDGFCRAMQQIFYRDSAWTLRTFHEWARGQQPIYDDLIARTLERVALPPDGTADYYSSLEKQLIGLRMLRRTGRVNEAIKRVAKQARDRRSQVKNEATHRGRARGGALPKRQHGSGD